MKAIVLQALQVCSTALSRCAAPGQLIENGDTPDDAGRESFGHTEDAAAPPPALPARLGPDSISYSVNGQLCVAG
jgi:hypothetical protein